MVSKKSVSFAPFFALTFGFSWLAWIPVALFNPPMGITMPVVLLGAFAPSFVGIALTYFERNPEKWRDFWKRVTDFKLIGMRWYLVILLFSPLLRALTALVDMLLGGDTPSLDLQTLTEPASLAGFLLLMILGGPLAEELGWRGFALDALQSKSSALVASLALGVIWGWWHLPLFFVDGTSQAEVGFGTLGFWLYLIQVIALSVLFTWVYNNNRRSILSAVLLHFMDNTAFSIFTPEGTKISDQTEIIATALYVAAAVLIVAFWGSKSMTRSNQSSSAKSG